jgi:hypothetical protein
VWEAAGSPNSGGEATKLRPYEEEREQMRLPTASVINIDPVIDPVVSGKHIGTSLLIEADSQHLHEKPAYACRIYRFNDYEYRCKLKTTLLDSPQMAEQTLLT